MDPDGFPGFQGAAARRAQQWSEEPGRKAVTEAIAGT